MSALTWTLVFAVAWMIGLFTGLALGVASRRRMDEPLSPAARKDLRRREAGDQ